MTQNISATTVSRAFLFSLANLIAVLVAIVCFAFASACWQICPAYGGTLAHELGHWHCGCTQRQPETLPAPSVHQTREREQLSAAKRVDDSHTWKLLFAIPKSVTVVDESGDVIHTHTVDEDGILRSRRVATYADARLDQILKPLGIRCEADVIAIDKVTMEKGQIGQESIQTAANLNAGGSYDTVIFLPYYTCSDLYAYSGIYGVCHYTRQSNDGTYTPILAVLCGDYGDSSWGIDWLKFNAGVFAHEFGHAIKYWARSIGFFSCPAVHQSYCVDFHDEPDWCWDLLAGQCLPPVLDHEPLSAGNQFHYDDKRAGIESEVWRYPYRIYNDEEAKKMRDTRIFRAIDELCAKGYSREKAIEHINLANNKYASENYPRGFFQEQGYTAGFSRTVVPTLEIKTSQDIWLLGETYSDHNPANFWRDVVSLYQVAAIPEEIMVIDNETEEQVNQLTKDGSYRIGLKAEAYTVRVASIKDLTYLSAQVYKLISEDNGSRLDFETICPWLVNVSGDLRLNDEAGSELSNGQKIDEGASLSAWKATTKVGVDTTKTDGSNGSGSGPKGCHTGASSLVLLLVMCSFVIRRTH